MAESTLTRDAIVAEAVRLADDGGLANVSMRRIADALGTGAMSLYRHVPDKEALVQQMAAAVGSQYHYPEELLGHPDWRRRAQIAAEIDWELYLRHPWVLLAHTMPRAAMTRASVLCFDWLVEAFSHLTADTTDAAQLTLQVWSHVQGAALGAVGQALVVPGSSVDTAGFVAGLADNPYIEDLPRLQGLVGRLEMGAALPLMTAGITALCEGYSVRFGGSPQV